MPAPLDEELLARARAAWPEIVIDATVFDAFLASADDGSDPADLDLPTLYLACACVAGDQRALASFEARYLALVPRLLSRITTDPQVIEEVKQQLRIKLFVPDETGVAKIARYRRGSLEPWLRVVACRLAIDLLRARGQPMVEIDERSLEHRALTDDPRLALLKQTYQAQVSTAFSNALAKLSATDRAMLRMCFIDDLGMEEIGKLYQLSKSAVSRRLSRCRETLLAEVKDRLRGELGVDDSELDSIMRLVTSQLHLSLPRVLQ